MNPDRIRISAAAVLMDRSDRSIYRYIGLGLIQSWRVCGRTYVSRAQILRLLDGEPSRPGTEPTA